MTDFSFEKPATGWGSFQFLARRASSCFPRESSGSPISCNDSSPISFGDTGDDTAMDDRGQRSRLADHAAHPAGSGGFLPGSRRGPDFLSIVSPSSSARLGVGVGLGPSEYRQQFRVGGSILIFDRPVRIGDNGGAGRQTRPGKGDRHPQQPPCMTEDGAEVIIPNGGRPFQPYRQLEP